MAQSPNADEAAARAAEALERLKQRCSDALGRIRVEAAAGRPAEVEAGVKTLHETMRDPTLPRDFVQQIGAELKGLDLMVHMKATDMALRRAVVHAQADRKTERNQEIAAARGFLGRALALGANEDFKHAAEMTIESALLTGGVKHAGPTRAKPADETPPVRSLAKGERREFKRYEAPVLTVTVHEKSFHTLNWSMGGMLVGGSTVDDFPSGEPAQITLGALDTHHPAHASVIEVRVEIRRGGMAVRFLQMTPELMSFLRGLILHRGDH